jgi:DNA-binding response OmpR family regulator
MARVLTIEDDAVTAREIVAELTSRGNQVDWVDNGAAGLSRASTGGYDAITLDRMLPGLDGLAVVTALREAGVGTPVLMISALSDVDERVRGLRAGGDDLDVARVLARLRERNRRSVGDVAHAISLNRSTARRRTEVARGFSARS